MERKHKIIIGALLFFIFSALVSITQWEFLKNFLSGGNFAFIDHHVSKSPEEIIATMKIPERYRDGTTAAPERPESSRTFSPGNLLRGTPSTPPQRPEEPPLEQAYDPALARAYFQKAREHDQSGEFRDAMEAYQLGLQYDQTNSEAFYRYGVIAYDFGQRQEAMGALARAVQMEPANVDYRMTYARMLAQNNLREDARVQLQEVLRIDPGNRTAGTLLRTLER
ncbi:Tetratricopeptide repeat-containing protein [Desulfurispirillum indicum S5]|uniref:Tetratricopeptide repeat-containing protein n=1 Tax=Desulfurispirillum indicum (strain ATCC BAA-1389 / DSM 22839 / S5) TaxID=653733 RepID=E6W1X9_DESIS|nr:tetratricopeptide repeat protein [Desulfurispirillum indicum]ADU65511.1 Tetratricopeptide repeat-containing protein [Desulfurispirillum indicum S5]